MKLLIIIIFLMSGIWSQAQTTASQLSALRAQDIIINQSIADLNAAIVKLLAIIAEQDKKIANIPTSAPVIQSNKWFTDSIKPIKAELFRGIEGVASMMPATLTLYVDTMSGLKFKQDTLYFKK